MSDSEKMGRCFSEVHECRGSPSELKIADAIDRLAADVAAVMEMTQEIALRVPSEFGLDACDVAVRVLEKDRDAAIRKRDEARAEVERLKCSMTETSKVRDAAIRERDAANQRRADTVRRLVQAQAEVAQLRGSRDVANRLFGAEQAKVERLRKELEQRQPAGNSPKTSDSSPAAPQPAAASDAQPDAWAVRRVGDGFWAIGSSRSDAEKCALDWNRAGVWQYEVVPLYAAPQPVPPPAGWLTDDERDALEDLAFRIERWVNIDKYDADRKRLAALRSILARAGSPPEQAAAGWLTDEERRALFRAFDLLCDDDGDSPLAGTVQVLLARAGSPPVVEVPAMGFLGAMTGREQGIVLAYRDALDAAGVKWKEVGRE